MIQISNPTSSNSNKLKSQKQNDDYGWKMIKAILKKEDKRIRKKEM